MDSDFEESSRTLNLIRSPNNAPPLRGDVGSTANTAILCLGDNRCNTPSTMQDLPTPGGPVIATIKP